MLLIFPRISTEEKGLQGASKKNGKMAAEAAPPKSDTLTKTPMQATIMLKTKSRSIGHLPRRSVECFGLFGFERRESSDSFAGREVAPSSPQREKRTGFLGA
jgi:hypothetical protein